jgi:hypothetical protein
VSNRSNGNERSLKNVSANDIEGAIACAISELSGSEYIAHLIRMDFEPTSAGSDDYELVIRLSHVLATPHEQQITPANAGTKELRRAAVDRSLTGLTGRQVNQEWEVGARHALYHHEGQWYHQLLRFPGALFDCNGYILFETRDVFRNCSYLNITQDVHIPQGIAAIPGYVRRRP